MHVLTALTSLCTHVTFLSTFLFVFLHLCDLILVYCVPYVCVNKPFHALPQALPLLPAYISTYPVPLPRYLVSPCMCVFVKLEFKPITA